MATVEFPSNGGPGVSRRTHLGVGIKGHAFFNDTNRMGTIDEQAAQQSWQKTLDFLRAHLA